MIGDRLPLFYQPSLLSDPSGEHSAWSQSIFRYGDGLANLVAVRRFHGEPGRPDDMGFAVALSDDGVHWREVQSFALPNPATLAGYCVRQAGDQVVLYNSELNQGADREAYPVVCRQYRSTDLATWEAMGDEFTTRPDPRWYRCRWDELVILADDGCFYGYITSEPHPHLATDSLGMLRSDDAINWEVLPPPVFDWDGLPPHQMEVCFCERIGDRYYLGMGSRCYLGHLGYSVMMFVADSPTGPFRPDRDAFRLCGTTSRDVTWLAKTVRWNGELLVTGWTTTGNDRRRPGIFSNGATLWVPPLKRLVADPGGHARIAWWPGNEAARGPRVEVDLSGAGLAHPPAGYPGSIGGLVCATDGVTITVGHDGALAFLPATLDLDGGVLVEGVLEATELRSAIGTHWHPAAVGFFLEEGPGRGMLVQLETLGLTRIGLFEYAAEPRFDADEYGLAGWGNTQREGEYLGLSRFTQEDVVGPIGYAGPCGVQSGRMHRFRLLVAHGIFELYLDDLLVQSYITGPTTGRLGLFGRSGRAEVRGLVIHTVV